jgi:hypothetical protein
MNEGKNIMAEFCTQCGKGIASDGMFCNWCGKPKPAMAHSSEMAAAAAPSPIRESELYNCEGVIVTTARFIVYAQTFAVRGITSVAAVPERPGQAGPWALGIIAMLGLIFGAVAEAPIAMALALLFLLAAIAVAAQRKSSAWLIVLNTAGGEVKAFRSESGEQVRQIADAINRAMARA